MRRCVWSRNIKNRCSIYIYIYIYIYDISSLRVNGWLFVVVRDFSLSRLYTCRSPPSRMWCCITGRSVRIFWDSMMMTSSGVEYLHWTLRSLKLRPLGCLERSGTYHPVTLPHTGWTETLSCLNWTDERITIPVPPPVLRCSRLTTESRSLGDFVAVRTSTYTNLDSIAYYTPSLYIAYCS